MAALASWLDARANKGEWLVRIEDTDTPRSVPGMADVILQQLSACGLLSDLPVVWQSQRTGLYQQALEQLIAQGLSYPCACSRKDIELTLSTLGYEHARHSEVIYPGTCRKGLQGKPARAWRLRTDLFSPHPTWQWTDRRLGNQQQNVALEVGDFVLKRADGCFTYQLAVVVDDAAQGITDVVRGEDLADNTARQIAIQQSLHLPTPRYLHTPLVMGLNGEKLSKQNGAQALDTSDPMAALNLAAQVLGLNAKNTTVAQALTDWVCEWQSRWGTVLYNPVP